MTKVNLNQHHVTQHSRVLADVTVKLKDGSIADSTKIKGEPSWLIMGDQSFSAAFESFLLGREVGENLVFELDAKDAFGGSNPDQIHFMDAALFPPEMTLKPGEIIAFDQPHGGQVPGIVISVEGDSVKIDFNHPLAGQNVIFEIQIKQIR